MHAQKLGRTKGLDGYFPYEWKEREACKSHSLCLHFTWACGMKTGAAGWIVLHAGDISKELEIPEEFRNAYANSEQSRYSLHLGQMYFSDEWQKPYSWCHCQYQFLVWKIETWEFLCKACREYFSIGERKKCFISLSSLRLNKVIYGNQQAKNDPHWKGGKDTRDISSIFGS